MDNSDVKDETIWRSIDSDSDNNPNDESNSTIFFDLPDDDQVYFDARKSSFCGDKTIIEAGLLDAMRDLQIKSANKLKLQQEKCNSIDNKISVNLENLMNIQDCLNEENNNDKQFKNISTIQENIEIKTEINSKTEAVLLEEEKLIPVDKVTLDTSEKNLKSPKTQFNNAENIIEPSEIILTGSEINSTTKEIISVDVKTICQEENKTPEAIIKNVCIELDEGTKTTDDMVNVEETKINPEDSKQSKSILKICDVDLTQPNIILNECQKVPLVFSSSMVKAMKPLLQQPSKKPSTIPITPKLLSSSRNRTIPKSIGDSSQSKLQPTNNKSQCTIRKSMAPTSTSLSSAKPQLTNNKSQSIIRKSMVPTSTSLSQSKSQLTNNKSQSIIKKSMSTNSSILKRQNSNISNTSDKSTSSIKKNGQKLITTVSTITTTKDGMKLKDEKINNFSIPVTVNRKKRTQFVPFNFSSREKINKDKLIVNKKIDNNKNKNLLKENKTNNIIPLKINIEKKNKERCEINEKIKKLQIESKKLHNDIVNKKIILKNNEDIEMRKTTIIKPTVMPNFKISTGLKIKNNSIVSSCAIKNKRV